MIRRTPPGEKVINPQVGWVKATISEEILD